MGPASLKFTWFAKLLWFAVDSEMVLALERAGGQHQGLLARTALLAAGSTFVDRRDFRTIEDSMFEAIVCSMTVVAPSPDTLLPEGSVWPWAMAGTAACHQRDCRD
jgi:hypothetical protein